MGACIPAMLAWSWLLVMGQAPLSPPIEDEPNNDIDHASWLDLPVVGGQACIGPAGEVDYYQFSLEKSGPLVVGVHLRPVPGHGSQPLLGLPFSVVLYDERQVELGRSMDSLEMPLLAAGTYFLSVSHVQKVCYELNVYVRPHTTARAPGQLTTGCDKVCPRL
jgi:hypothetical protein